MNMNDIIKQAQRTAMAGLHVSMPGKVSKVNGNSIDVQPSIKLKTEKGNKSSAQLLNVPVVQPASGGFEITFPIHVGDDVLVVFSDKCLDAWTKTGKESNEAEHRSHHLSDAIAIIGLQSEPNSKVRKTGGLEIKGHGAKIELTKAGLINMTSPLVTINGNLFVTQNIEAGGSCC